MFIFVVNFVGHVDAAKVLLDYGSDVNAKGNDDWTSLHFASAHGNYLSV